MRKTKIVATVGPATKSPQALENLVEAGLDVVRLNFSHGTRAEHEKVITEVRRIARERGRGIAILQDLAGPKIRTGPIENGPIRLEAGQTFVLTNREVPGSRNEVSLTYPRLPQDVHLGDTLLLCDGELELVVLEKSATDIRCRVIVGGPLNSFKGINLPSRSISAPLLSEKDWADLAFGLRQGVDYVALSFVRTALEVEEAREFIKKSGRRDTPLIAKIEKHEALNHIDEIISAVDGIMIARGDLGVEIPIEQVPRVQKMLIEKANRAGKPVITATQMLGSMVRNPRPTRAEVTDVANAIIDGSDAIMLSEETAVGEYAATAVRTMARIAFETELAFPFAGWMFKFGQLQLSSQEAVALAACQMAERVQASAIITFTQSGSTTRLVAKYRPPRPILAMTPMASTYVQLALVWGALPFLMPPSYKESEMEEQALRLALDAGLLKPGQTIVITAGLPIHVAGTTNLIKVTTVG